MDSKHISAYRLSNLFWTDKIWPAVCHTATAQYTTETWFRKIHQDIYVMAFQGTYYIWHKIV